MKDIKVLTETLSDMEIKTTEEQLEVVREMMDTNMDQILLLAQENGFATTEEPLSVEEVVALSAYIGLEDLGSSASLGILRKVKEAIEIH
jgi:hypothetical protein